MSTIIETGNIFKASHISKTKIHKIIWYWLFHIFIIVEDQKGRIKEMIEGTPHNNTNYCVSFFRKVDRSYRQRWATNYLINALDMTRIVIDVIAVHPRQTAATTGVTTDTTGAGLGTTVTAIIDAGGATRETSSSAESSVKKRGESRRAGASSRSTGTKVACMAGRTTITTQTRESWKNSPRNSLAETDSL